MALYPFSTVALASLTSAGVTPSVEVTSESLTFQITTSGVATNVVIRMEGSLDGTNFFNLDEDEQNTTLIADGTTGYALNGCPVRHVRVRLVSISGGTPTVSSSVGAG